MGVGRCPRWGFEIHFSLQSIRDPSESDEKLRREDLRCVWGVLARAPSSEPLVRSILSFLLPSEATYHCLGETWLAGAPIQLPHRIKQGREAQESEPM